MGSDLIYNQATTLLVDVVDIFSDEGISLPDLRYIHSGEVAYDCDLVAVQVSRIRIGSPSREQTQSVAKTMFETGVAYRIHVIRKLCAILQDEGKFPTADQFDQDALVAMQDGWVLFNGLVTRANQGTLAAGVLCDEIVIGPAATTGPQGGLGGWTCEVVLAPVDPLGS